MNIFSVVVILVAIMPHQYSSSGAGNSVPRPDPEKSALFARWLINQTSYGVLSTLDTTTDSPFGNIHSHADAGTGVPFFYQSRILDRTGRNAVIDSRASFTVTESPLGFCDSLEAQSPKCGKLTLSGQLRLLEKNTSEGKFGEAALFAAHPGFLGFPKQKKFDVFKLMIEDIFLVDKAAPPPNISVADYLNVKL